MVLYGAAMADQGVRLVVRVPVSVTVTVDAAEWQRRFMTDDDPEEIKRIVRGRAERAVRDDLADLGVLAPEPE